MKQLLQSVSERKSYVADVPASKPGRGEVLVRVMASLISAGTEKNAVDFADKNLIAKALARPDLVRQVIDKTKRDGFSNTFRAVQNKLDGSLSLGYSNSGVVISVGADVRDVKPGDRVACGGGTYATHAEIVRVPRNLVAKIPDGPDFEEAAFTTVGSIAMQGFRLSDAVVGETIAVIGLGLVGLLLVQIAKAAGCRVVGMDPNPSRCELAQSLGCDSSATDADSMRRLVSGLTASAGVDAVIITAATSSNAPVELAGELARSHGRVIVVGAVGLQLQRQPFYEKELVLRISCSYGPGRYDQRYEEGGLDYPIGFVRWTENRNMQAVLQLMAEGKLKTKPLITHNFPIEQSAEGYDLLSGRRSEPYLGIVIQYPQEPSPTRRIDLRQRPPVTASSPLCVGLIGAGNFATGMLLPAAKAAADLRLVGVCTGTGSTAYGVGSRQGFEYCTTDSDEIIGDPDINTVVIATRHNSHARLICAALAQDKNVFCEKPLCINEQELADIVREHESSNGTSMLMVGFNRRFSPMAVQLRAFASAGQEPVLVNCRVNAGFIPSDHWTQNPEVGAGRVIGEVCHFVDLCSFLAGGSVISVQASALPDCGRYSGDNLSAILTYDNGSIATINYVANGDKSVPKERIEVFAGEGAAVLDDFRQLQISRAGRQKVIRSRFRQDKGHTAEWRAFAVAIQSGVASPIPFEQVINTTLTTFAILRACSSRETEAVDTRAFIALETHASK